MDRKSFLVIAALCLPSSAVHSAIITYGSYSHDTNTDIVVGDGLEWLQWDRTIGKSWLEASTLKNTIEGGGWEIASNAQIATLFNNFNFGFGVTFDSDENTTQSVSTGIQTDGLSSDPSESDVLFVNMFGHTMSNITSSMFPGSMFSGAWFGLDADNDLQINQAFVRDDYSHTGISRPGEVTMKSDSYSQVIGHYNYGVALVRDATSSVPEPSILVLMAIGLIGFGFTRRRRAQY